MLSRTMARHTIAASGRNTRLQVRNGRVAEAAVAIMGDVYRLVVGSTRIVTARTGCPVDVLNTTNNYIPSSCMGCVCHCLISMAIKATCRIGANSNGVNNFLSWAVMTSGAGTIVLALYFYPICHSMTVAAGDAARQVSGSQCNRMCIGRMLCIETTGMAGCTITSTRLARRRTDQNSRIGIVAANAGVMGLRCGADQGIIVTIRATGRSNSHQTVVSKCGRRVICCPGVGMTGGAVTAGGEGSTHGRTDQGIGIGVMAACAGIMGISGRTVEGVIVAAGATGRADSHDRAMINAAMRRRGC